MKRVIAPILIVALLLLSFPTTFVVSGFCLPSQFDESYYGELGEMHDKLIETKGPKMVIIGTSSVAFGVDSSLLEKELAKCGKNYTVCNFGLYGALGTKLMMDLSINHINEGDIVIFSPEYLAQELSLYFSASHTWKAMDGHFDMLFELDDDNISVMVGNYMYFVSEKFEHYKNGKKPVVDGEKTATEVYNKSSFDENCNMIFDRKYNVMDGGYDENAPIILDKSIFEKAFIDYVNEYANTIRKKGATIYYAFSPMNNAAIKDFDEATTYELYSFINESFDFPVIGNINDYCMDYEWFYDSNVHLNSAGAIVRTKQLIDDLKTEWGYSSPTQIEIPLKPEIPESEDTGNGNNTHSNCFIYELNESGTYTITKATNEIDNKTEIIIPYSYNGKKITRIEEEVFANNTKIEQVTIQKNIRILKDNMFNGCSSLKKIILEQTSPTLLSVGQELLNGTDGCYIYVKDDATREDYAKAYFWGHYASRIKVNK